jgi:hypothetical protein
MSVASPTGRVEGSRREAIRIGGLATSSMHPCLSGPDRRLRTAVSSADRAESLGL